MENCLYKFKINFDKNKLLQESKVFNYKPVNKQNFLTRSSDEIHNDDLSFIIGPCNVSFEEIIPKLPSPSIFFLLPSFISISRTDDKRPPKRAGKPPLVNLTFLIASALKKENKHLLLMRVSIMKKFL